MKQYKYIAAAAFLMMAFTACKKDLLKTNTDPNSVGVTLFDPNNLLTATQLFYTGSSDNAIEVEETEMFGVGCFIQHFASTSGIFFGDKYGFSPGGWGSFFDHAYTYDVKNAVALYNNTNGIPLYKNLHQISRIMKALVFERITDVYGDVPYFDAGKAYTEHIYFPKYDKQQDIYADMLKEVSQAVDSLDENADKPVGDMFYYGKPDQIGEWKKFGNTLLLRMAMRLTKVDPTTAQMWVNKVQGKTMTSNDDNAIVNHDTNDPLTINRIWRGVGEDGDVQLSWQMSDSFIGFMKSTNDPRLPVLAYVYPRTYDPESGDSPVGGSSDAASQVGLPNGLTNDTSATHGLLSLPGHKSLWKYSRPSPIIFNATAPTLILTYAESELLLADAANRWGIGDPATHYNNGVLAAITALSAYGSDAAISQTTAQSYLTAHPYNNADGLNMINTQFWLATFFNEYEAWSNWRRTSSKSNPNGYPALTPISFPGSQSFGAIPRRMPYSTIDRQVNGANYAAAVANLPGGDKLTSRMWWDNDKTN